jgi:hypothetical protein
MSWCGSWGSRVCGSWRGMSGLFECLLRCVYACSTQGPGRTWWQRRPSSTHCCRARYGPAAMVACRGSRWRVQRTLTTPPHCRLRYPPPLLLSRVRDLQGVSGAAHAVVDDYDDDGGEASGLFEGLVASAMQVRSSGSARVGLGPSHPILPLSELTRPCHALLDHLMTIPVVASRHRRAARRDARAGKGLRAIRLMLLEVRTWLELRKYNPLNTFSTPTT